MRIVAFRPGGNHALGVVEDGQVVNITAMGQPAELGMALRQQAGLSALAEATAEATRGKRLSLASLDFQLPVSTPPKIICLGLNYADHAAEGNHPPPTYPALFMRTVMSLTPHGAPIVRPRCSEKLDYEAELMVVIGRGGRHMPPPRTRKAAPA